MDPYTLSPYLTLNISEAIFEKFQGVFIPAREHRHSKMIAKGQHCEQHILSHHAGFASMADEEDEDSGTQCCRT